MVQKFLLKKTVIKSRMVLLFQLTMNHSLFLAANFFMVSLWLWQTDCVTHYAKDLSTRLVVGKSFKYGLRPFLIREYARLQGFPDDFHFENRRSAYKMIGNAVPVDMGKWIGKEVVKYFNQKK